MCRHCRVAHGVATDGNRIFVTGGSAKANSNFGPGLSEMEMCEVVDGKKPEWQLVGEMGEGRSFLGSVVLDSKVYQIGGCLSEEKSTTEVSFSCSHLRIGEVPRFGIRTQGSSRPYQEASARGTHRVRLW